MIVVALSHLLLLLLLLLLYLFHRVMILDCHFGTLFLQLFGLVEKL